MLMNIKSNKDKTYLYFTINIKYLLSIFSGIPFYFKIDISTVAEIKYIRKKWIQCVCVINLYEIMDLFVISCSIYEKKNA